MSYKYITNRDSPNFTAGRSGTKISGITLHWWGDPKQNPSFGGVVNWLCNKASGVSAHYVASGTDRQVACIVDPENTAWHAGNWNANLSQIGIECDPRCRASDYDVVAELIADLWKTYGKLPLYPHNKWRSTQCPGNYDLAKLKKLAEAKLNPPKKVSKPTPVTIKSSKAFGAKVFSVKADTKLVNIPADTTYNSTIYKKGTTIVAVELVTASNGKTFYRTRYAVDKKKMYGFKGNALVAVASPVSEEAFPVITKEDQAAIDKAQNDRLNVIEKLIKSISDFLSSIFKNWKG